MNRKSFIQQSLLVSAGVLASGKIFSAPHIKKPAAVVIIGAGLAGLSAACYLKKQGIQYVILEARDRVGGRVFSHVMDKTDNLVIELGAEWVGNSHSRIIELCNEYDLPLENNQFETDLIYKNQYSPAGSWDYTKEWKEKFNTILEKYPKLTAAEKRNIDKTDWWSFLVKNGCNDTDLDIRELLDSTDFGESIRHVSAFAALAEYAESSEKNEMDKKIKGGNSRLTEALAQKAGRENIKTGHPVTKVSQNLKTGVTVFCENGAQFKADKIICTIPVFSVKKIKWEPGFPATQWQALNELQYARINKNPILFNTRWWKREDFDMVSDQLPHYFYHATKNQRSGKGVLISYTTGDKAAVVANQSEQWRTQMLQQTLEPFFGNVADKIISQTNYYWGNDAFSRGAYALYGIDQWFRVMPQLRKPHLHTHFAGEHLADWQGFMEGAINSGEETAAIIAKG